MTNPIDLIKTEIKTIQEQLEIDVKKVSLLQQEIKEINEAAQPILENQGSLKKLNAVLEKLEGKIETTTKK